jgi:hypothetical protein
MQPLEPEPVSPVQTVDESTIDHLHAALERHRSIMKGRRPPSASSVTSSAGDEDDDYDYRLDTDPPAGKGLQPDTYADPVQSGVRRGSDNLQELLDHGVRDHVPTFIPLGETDGLPNIQQTDQKDDYNEARNLVRAHTGKWGILRRRVKGAAAVNRAFPAKFGDPEKSSRSDQEAFAARYPEHEEEDGMHHRSMPGMSSMALPGGASVLSSLLALYGQNMPGSEATSAASSRAPSEAGSSDDEISRRTKASDATLVTTARNHGWDGSMGNNLATPAGEPEGPIPAGPVGRRISVARPAAELETGQNLTKHLSESKPENSSPGIMSFFKKAKHDISERDRPKAARSGAGVFGALIQNTGNLSGAATPAASTLAPAAKRPGYQLSRYSLPDVTSEAPAPRQWRPESRPPSRMGSRPASVHSSTAVSRDGESPKEKDDSPIRRNVSSDDVMNTRSNSNMDPVRVNKRKSKNLNMNLNLGKISGNALKESGMALRTAEKWVMSGGRTPLRTPPEKAMDGYFTRPMTEDERRRSEWEKEKKRRKKAREARKKQEIFVRCTLIFKRFKLRSLDHSTCCCCSGTSAVLDEACSSLNDVSDLLPFIHQDRN